MEEQQDQAGGEVAQVDAQLSPEAMIEEKRKADELLERRLSPAGRGRGPVETDLIASLCSDLMVNCPIVEYFGVRDVLCQVRNSGLLRRL